MVPNAGDDGMTDSILFAAEGPVSELLVVVQEDGVDELLDMYPACELPDDDAVDVLANLLGCENGDGGPALDTAVGDGPWVLRASKRFYAIVHALNGKDLDALAAEWHEAHREVPAFELRAILDELAQVGGAVALGRSLFLAIEP